MSQTTVDAVKPAAVAIDPRPTTIPGVFFHQAAVRAERPYVRWWEGGSLRTLSWSEAAERTVRIACALLDAGLRAGDHVALMSPNRPEWLFCDFAIMAAGGITVPIYPSLTERVAGYIAEDSKARLAIASTPDLAAKLSGHAYPKTVFTIDGDVARWTAAEPTPDQRAALLARMAELKPDDVATVCYTSGTTGDPKGVILAHRHFVDTAKAALQMFNIGPDDELLSYLPYSHVLERIDGIFVETMAGCSFWLARSLDNLVEDIRASRPTIMLGVPRVFEKVYEAVFDQMRKQSLVKRAIFRWALGVGAARVRSEPGPWLRLRVRIADRLVLRQLRDRLTGGRLRFFISGGAPLNEKVEEFFWAIGVMILQGWGLTEASSGATSNTETLHRYRTVGVPLPGTQIRIAADGEILVKGPGVMVGYKNQPHATAEMFAGEWLKTGDMGFCDRDGFLTITDRKKDLIKTSGGKYVAPLPIESQLESDRYVKSAVVIGDQRPYVVALIVPDWAALEADDGFTGRPQDLARSQLARSRFAPVVDAANRSLASFETIKYFALLSRDFTEAEGELTPTLKKKRRIIAQHFAAEIEDLYATHRGGGGH